MPLLVPIVDPHSGDPRPNAWAWCAETNFSHRAKTARLVYEIFASPEAAYADPPLKPLLTLALDIRPEAQPAVYGSPPLLSPYAPAEYRTIREPGANGPDDEGEYELVSPAQDPVYGPAPLLRPAIPSYDELVDANQAAYGLLQIAVDELGLDALPEFAGGSIIPPGPPEEG